MVCKLYFKYFMCCQRKRKQNHIDYEAANTFKHIVFFLLNWRRIEGKFEICGVNDFSVYKSWSESKLLKWWFGLCVFFCFVLRGIIFVKEMRNSKSLKQMCHGFVACFAFNILSFDSLSSSSFILFYVSVFFWIYFATKIYPSHLLYTYDALYAHVIFNLHQ